MYRDIGSMLVADELLFPARSFPKFSMLSRRLLGAPLPCGARPAPMLDATAREDIMDLIAIGLAIRAVRLGRKMTASALAKAAGIRSSDLSKIENGKKILNFETASRIARALGLSLDQLVKKIDEIDRTNRRKLAKLAEAQKEARAIRQSILSAIT